MDKFQSLIQKFTVNSDWGKIFGGVVIVALVAGIGTGYILASSNNKGMAQVVQIQSKPKSAAQDNGTFRDFAEGTIQKKPQPKNPNEYVEGTHLLIRDGAQPVALTSSVVDLSQYEGKKVKVFGETQKALKEGWLMDIGKVDVE